MASRARSSVANGLACVPGLASLPFGRDMEVGGEGSLLRSLYQRSASEEGSEYVYECRGMLFLVRRVVCSDSAAVKTPLAARRPRPLPRAERMSSSGMPFMSGHYADPPNHNPAGKRVRLDLGRRKRSAGYAAPVKHHVVHQMLRVVAGDQDGIRLLPRDVLEPDALDSPRWRLAMRISRQ